MIGARPVTLSVASAAWVFGPCDEVTSPAGTELISTLGCGTTTSKLMSHWPGVVLTALGTVPPLNDTEVAPGTAVSVPPQFVTTFGVGATCIPVGSASTNASDVASTMLLFRK